MASDSGRRSGRVGDAVNSNDFAATYGYEFEEDFERFVNKYLEASEVERPIVQNDADADVPF
jgi:hypothetical protein